MSATTYDTITWRIESTVQLPTRINASTDPQTVDYCQHAYYRIAHNAMQHNGDLFPYETLVAVIEALMEGGAVTTLYTHKSDETGEMETAARTLFPQYVALTRDHHIVTLAYCTLRRTYKLFRLDRMRGCHLLTVPDGAPAETEQAA